MGTYNTMQNKLQQQIPMDILVITHDSERASFRQRIGIYLDHLREIGIGSKVVVLPKKEWQRHRLFRKAQNYSGVFLHKKRLNRLDAFWLRRYARKILYDFDDAVMFNENAPERDSPSRQRLFARTVKLADLVIAGNTYLATQARMFNDKVEIVPTGLSLSDYNVPTKKIEDGKVRLVWVGSQSTLRYLENVRGLFDELAVRYSQVILRIVADAFFDSKLMTVEKQTWSLDRQSVDLAECDIGLAPLPNDRFTRGKCGFKILQYQAAGLPVIASPVGVNAELVKEGINGYLAADNKTWLERVSDLITDAAKRQQMGVSGRQGYSKCYNTDFLGQRIAELVQDTLIN